MQRCTRCGKEGPDEQAICLRCGGNMGPLVVLFIQMCTAKQV